jgi:hypothetical protein
MRQHHSPRINPLSMLALRRSPGLEIQKGPGNYFADFF